MQIDKHKQLHLIGAVFGKQTLDGTKQKHSAKESNGFICNPSEVLQSLLYNYSFKLKTKHRQNLTSTLLRRANSSKNGREDRITQLWRRNERQMVMELSGPNKTC